MATVGARPGNPAVVKYKVTASNGTSEQTCYVKAGTTPLRCWLGGLAPSTEYSVSAVACLPRNAGCGPAIRTPTATYPTGKFYLVKGL